MNVFVALIDKKKDESMCVEGHVNHPFNVTINDLTLIFSVENWIPH